MLSCCLRCKKETDNNNPQVSETPNGNIVLFVQSFIVKNQDLWKKQEARKLLRKLEIKALLRNVPILEDIFKDEWNKKISLTNDKFIPEPHLRKPCFTRSSCIWFTKHRKDLKI